MKHKRAIAAASLLTAGLVVGTSIALTGSGDVAPVPNKWSFTDQCTPAAPGDSSGHTGIGTVKADSRPTSVFAVDNDLVLTDSHAGVLRGNVVAVAVDAGETDLTFLGKLNFLVANRTVDPIWFDGSDPLLAAPVTAIGAAVPGTVNDPYAVAVDPYDNSFFVTSASEAGRVNKYSASGVFVAAFPAAGALSVGNLTVAVSPVDGAVAIGLGADSAIYIFRPDVGRTVYTLDSSIGSLGAGNGQFGNTSPIPVVFDSTGKLFAGDRGNSRLQSFTVGAGTITYSAQVSIPGYVATTPIYELTISSTDVLHVSLLTSLNAEAIGTIKTYNTSLVLQNTFTFLAPAGTRAGILNIEADATGIWANWGFSNYLVHYSGVNLVEDNRWYSGYKASIDLNTNYGIAAKTTGEIVVLFKSTTLQTEPGLYGTYRVTSFDWNPVPLSDAIENYMLECDSTLGGLNYSYDAAVDPDVIFPAWSGDVWSKLKEICTAYGLEIYLDDDTIRVEDVGARTITLRNHTPLRITPTNVFGGQQLIMVAQNPTAGGGTVFDAGASGARFQIDVGQTSKVVVSTLNYPAIVDALAPTDTLPILPGQYYVLDSTGTHVPAATWLGAGAGVTPGLGDSPGQVSFTLLGPATPISGYTGPFTFADSLATTGQGALILTGQGVFTSPKSYTFETGANPTKTTQLVARTINSFAIASMEQIFAIAPAAIDDVSGVNVSVTFEMPTADLLGFGLTTGSIFTAENSKYRVTDVQFGGLKASITATRHITIDDVDTATTGLTVDQRDAIWTGYSIDDRGIKPLALSL